MTRRMTARWLAVGAAAASLALWATPVFAADQTVTIAGFAFNPGEVTVSVGDTVTWTNNDVRGHTATANDASFDTGTISVGSSQSVTFDTAGTFPYHCTIHPDMTATVVVEAVAASPSAAPSSSPAAPAPSGSGGTGGTASPPPTDASPAARPPSVGSDLILVSALALLVAAAAVLALLALRLRPTDESDKDS